MTPSPMLGDLPPMDLLKHWFEECCRNHPFCLSPALPFSPTRLLLIENEHSTKIVDTKGWNVHPSYAALSHCWGNANRLILEKNNIADLHKHISISELPTTYREGICVSLALGISYIWIDSLCIIQDDEEDWDKEAAMMKDVFEHCAINVSAAMAADSSQSSFRHSDPTIIAPIKVTIHQEKENKTIQSGFWLANSWPELKRQDIQYSPLHSRAWVFQETKLSRRRIELGRSQMWWFCQQNWACETYPLGVYDISDAMGELRRGDDTQHYLNMRKRRGAHLKTPLPISLLQGSSSQVPDITAHSDTTVGIKTWRHTPNAPSPKKQTG